jgi:hypothetical protein
MFFSLKVKNSIPRNRYCQRSTKIAVEGKIFAFGFWKKSDLSLLSIECQVLDRVCAFDRLVSVDAHLWYIQVQIFLSDQAGSGWYRQRTEFG